MSTRFDTAIICIAFIASLILVELLKAQSPAQSPTQFRSSAVDAKGVRHRMSDYAEGRAPWDADMIRFVKPDYPAEYRARYVEGTGLFNITLDVKTGSVTNVAVINSTGSPGLDTCAIKAIRQWRWRPRTWKEVDMPVTFTMGSRGRSGGSTGQLIARGRAYYINCHNATAIKAFDEAIRLQPTIAEPYIMRGSAYHAQGQLDKALADFDRAIQLDPKSGRAFVIVRFFKTSYHNPIRR